MLKRIYKDKTLSRDQLKLCLDTLKTVLKEVYAWKEGLLLSVFKVDLEMEDREAMILKLEHARSVIRKRLKNIP